MLTYHENVGFSPQGPLNKSADADVSALKWESSTMGAKLVIIKQVRASTDVPFFTRNVDQRKADAAGLKQEGIRATVGERNFKGGLKKVRTVFLPTTEIYEKWKASQTLAGINAERAAYNEANGIKERMIEIDLPNYKL